MSKTVQPPSELLHPSEEQRRPVRRQHRASLLGVWMGWIGRMSVLLLMACFFGVPLLWLVLAPSKGSNHELFNTPPISFGSFSNYVKAWANLLYYNNAQILLWMWNSVVYAIFSLVLAVTICVLAGYVLGTAKFAGRKLILNLTLIIMGIPSIAFVLPLFLEFNALGLIDSMLAVILPSAFYPFGVYLSFIFFSTSMPRDLLNAARIDGCSEIQLFWHVALPLAKSQMALLAFFNFVASWNNFFLPATVLTDPLLYNLPVGLGVLLGGAPGIRPSIGTELPIFGAEIAMAGLITILPIVLIFLFTQRLVVAGTLSGAEKE